MARITNGSGLRIDKYYDIRCEKCGLARSTDFDLGWWEFNAKSFRKVLQKEGWRQIDGENRCTRCVGSGTIVTK